MRFRRILFWGIIFCSITHSQLSCWGLPIDLSQNTFDIYRESSPHKITKHKTPIIISKLGFESQPKHRFFSFKRYPPEGFTLVTKFNLNDADISTHNSLGLYFARLASNWTISLNGIEIKRDIHSGSSFLSPVTSHGVIVELPSRILKKSNELTIKLMGDPSDSRIGLPNSGPYYIDDLESVYREEGFSTELIFCAIYLFIGIYHLILFFQRPKEKYNLYFGSFSVSFSIFLSTQSATIHQIWPTFNYFKPIEIFTEIPLFFLFPAFLDSILNKKLSKFTYGYGIFILVVLYPFVFFTHYPVVHDMDLLWQLSGFPVIFYCLFMVIKGYIAAVREACLTSHSSVRKMALKMIFQSIPGNLLIGTFLLCSSASFEIVNQIFFKIDLIVSYYTFIIVIIGAFIMLSNDVNRVRFRIEFLNTALKKEIDAHKQSNELLKKANQAKTDFLNMISHELRTPLHAISGVIDVLTKKETKLINSKYLESFQIINRSIDHLSSVILDILSVQELEKKAVPVNHLFLLSSVFSHVSQFIEAKNNNPSVQYIAQNELPDSFTVYSDMKRLVFMVEKLLINAIQFTHKGQILLRAYTQSEEPLRLYFEITDTGIGIPEKDYQIIFEPFTQLDQHITRRVRGVGLGLAVSKNSIDTLNGAIEVESEVNRGTTFRFWIPLPPTESAKSIDSKRLPMAQLKTKTILYCDDDPFNLAFLEMILSPIAQYEGVNLGALAIEKTKTKKYDLIFMDIQMPEKSGTETMIEIKALEPNIQTPIIALTAQALPGDREKYLLQGFDGYIAKPVKEEEIIDFLRQTLGSAQKQLRS